MRVYMLLNLPFLAVAAVLALVSLVRPGWRRRMLASALTAAVLCILTAVFDNVMIAAALFSYPEENLSGIRIGLAPIEDFAYPVAAAFAVPAIWSLVGGTHRRASPSSQTGPSR